MQFEEATALLADKDQQLLEENLQVKRLESQLAERDAEIEYLNKKVTDLKACVESWVKEFTIKHQQLTTSQQEVAQACREGKAEGIRLGWEQAKREAISAVKKIVDALKPVSSDIRVAEYEYMQYFIASMSARG